MLYKEIVVISWEPYKTQIHSVNRTVNLMLKIKQALGIEVLIYISAFQTFFRWTLFQTELFHGTPHLFLIWQ